MKRLFSLLIVYITVVAGYAQTHMRIHHNGGGHSDVPIEQIDSITFVDGDEGQAEEVELTGCWLWGNSEMLTALSAMRICSTNN